MEKIKTLVEMWRQVLLITPKEYKKKLSNVLLCNVLASIMELLSVALVIPFINAILDADILMHNKYISIICTFFQIDNKYDLVLFFAVVLVSAFLIKNILLIVVRQYQNIFINRLDKSLSLKLLKSYMERPYEFFLRNNTGYLAGKVSNDTISVYSVLDAFISLIAETFTVLAIGIYTFYVDPVMAIGVIFAAGLCVIVITLGLKNRIARVGNIRSKAYSENTKDIMQALEGIKDIILMKYRKHFVNAYSRSLEKRVKSNIDFLFYNQLPERIVEFLFVGCFVMIVTFRMRWGTQMMDYVPKLAAFAMAAYRLLPSIAKYTSNINLLIYYQPSLESAYQTVKEAECYKSDIDNRAIEKEGEVAYKELSHAIVAKNVFYKYSDDSDYILEGITLSIKKGEAIGLVGESGAGKSTFGDVILGLLVPNSGSIYMDGMDIRTIPESWSRNVGYVPQTVFLLDGTIRENVGFGLEIDEIDDEAVWEALERASLKQFIESLPDGLYTQVGERGVRLSGGQRQRVAIARALYRHPTIMVLDEATSALDNDTETVIMDAIENLMGSVTLIIIAHRLTTISNCDRVYEIKNGKAIERTKKELGLCG